jgi:short-subunit dehydrogenase
LSNELDLVKVEKVLADSWKTVDAIVNAGSFLSKPFAETTQDYESVYKVNVFAVANLTHLSALPAKRSCGYH